MMRTFDVLSRKYTKNLLVFCLFSFRANAQKFTEIEKKTLDGVDETSIEHLYAFLLLYYKMRSIKIKTTVYTNCDDRHYGYGPR